MTVRIVKEPQNERTARWPGAFQRRIGSPGTRTTRFQRGIVTRKIPLTNDPTVGYLSPQFTRDGATLICKAVTTADVGQIRRFTRLNEQVVVESNVKTSEDIRVSALPRSGTFWVAYNTIDDVEVFVAPIEDIGIDPFLVSSGVVDPLGEKQGILWGGDVEWIYTERGGPNDLIRSRFKVSTAEPQVEQLVIEGDDFPRPEIETITGNGSACPVLDPRHFNFGRLLMTGRFGVNFPPEFPDEGFIRDKSIVLVRVKDAPSSDSPFSVNVPVEVRVVIPFSVGDMSSLGPLGQPEWSPDGFMYAFTAKNAPGGVGVGNNILIAVFDPQEPRDDMIRCFSLTQTTDTTTRGNIQWSEDGQYIIYERRVDPGSNTPRSLYFIDVKGNLPPLETTPSGICRQLMVDEREIEGPGVVGACWRPKTSRRIVVYSFKSPMAGGTNQLFAAILGVP